MVSPFHTVDQRRHQLTHAPGRTCRCQRTTSCPHFRGRPQRLNTCSSPLNTNDGKSRYPCLGQTASARSHANKSNTETG